MSKHKRLTNKEVNKFKPSFFNQLHVKSDKEIHPNIMEIRIISPIMTDKTRSTFFAIDLNNNINWYYAATLEHYPSISDNE